MHTVSLKHALSAGLLAALLGMAAPLAVPAARALAETGGEASSTSQASATPSAGTTAGTTTSGTPIAEPSPAGGSTTNGSTSGGAAPTPSSTSKRMLATWYGPGFYGHTTACGQKLTPKLVGLASRTLPCGTLVRISYGGRLLTAPVLDRGPYGNNGAMWDLTSGAARALVIKETVRIGTQVVGSVPNTPTLGESPFSATLSPTTPASASASPEAPASTSPATQSSTTPASAATGGVSAS